MSILKKNRENAGRKVKLSKQRVRFEKPKNKRSRAEKKITFQRIAASIVTLGIVGFMPT